MSRRPITPQHSNASFFVRRRTSCRICVGYLPPSIAIFLIQRRGMHAVEATSQRASGFLALLFFVSFRRFYALPDRYRCSPVLWHLPRVDLLGVYAGASGGLHFPTPPPCAMGLLFHTAVWGSTGSTGVTNRGS